MGFLSGSAIKNLPASAEDVGSISGPGRFLGEENGNPLQNSCQENPVHSGVLWATVHGVAKTGTQFGDWTCTKVMSVKSSSWIQLVFLQQPCSSMWGYKEKEVVRIPKEASHQNSSVLAMWSQNSSLWDCETFMFVV